MTQMGSYCKAYYVRDLAAFPGWRPDLGSLRPETREEEGREVEVQRAALAGDDVLFLQEDFGVTDGIFLDEHVVFADAGPEWRAFCAGELGFAVPDYAVPAPPAAEAVDEPAAEAAAA
ncbi:MAG TPA: hypothetical protein VFR81_21480 [Longimicrobium sp.]|nr:hypothetical protein [Longimicrobium sp.]